MSKNRKPQFGKLLPLYNFVINPYPDQRFTRCPICKNRTGQSKVSLLIHIAPKYPLALGYTCRYCKHCDLLIANKHEIEHLLTKIFRQNKPDIVGNEYLVIGTVEKEAWREGLTQPRAITEMLEQTHDLKAVYEEIRLTHPGWYGPGQTAPIMEPPSSTEWLQCPP